MANSRSYQDEDDLREMYHDEGMSLREIADELDTSNVTVLRWMDRHGISRRSKREAREGGVALSTDDRGYERLTVSLGTDTAVFRVHQLVALLAGEDPHKVFSNGEYEVHHKNGIPWDNRPANLELMDPEEHRIHHVQQRERNRRGQFS